jgi:acetyltransferase-like isoleucine patch superfamily enzyme
MVKSLAKSVLLWVAIGLVSPLILSVWINGWLVGRKRAFESGAQWISLVPGNFGNALRSAYYYCTMDRFHPTARVCLGSVICDPRSEIGSHVYIGTYCEMGWVKIGKDTLVASRVMIPSGKRVHHFEQLDRPIRMQGGSPEQVVIGDDCWLGTSAVVMAEVGSQCVVAAGAVVVKPLPSKSICGGCPARVLRPREATESDREIQE